MRKTNEAPDLGRGTASQRTGLLETDDIQAHILRSLAPDQALYLFLTITDAAAFRRTLSWLLRLNNPRLFSEANRPARGAATGLQIGFTYGGLKALEVDDATLASFPTAFREGMAERAAALGDTGPSAPENWDGMLGSRAVHCVIAAYTHRPRDLERLAGRLARRTAGRHGFRVLHAECGQTIRDPQAGYPIEHFGFRDGISQPFVDLGTGMARPGGGVPKKDGRWDPVAPGEFILGYPDEDGLVQHLPRNEALRRNATYMVFRKLAQDVVGFRNYLKSQRETPAEQHRLAAQMLGRWRNGTPLVHSESGPLGQGPGGGEMRLNDFRYEADDPQGRKCPFAAHVRRANPRDTNFRDDARRHRLLRRGIPYGGAPLPEGMLGDGRERGLLFVAFAARIDQQFEFVQQHWLNRGDVMGQAGLNKDPIVGDNAGRAEDMFATPDRPDPATRLPRFVSVKGGEYFYVPGVSAIRLLAAGERFPAPAPEPGQVPSAEPAAGGDGDVVEDPSFFKVENLYRQGALLLQSRQPALLKRIPIVDPHARTVRHEPIALVARHDLIVEALQKEPPFLVADYDARVRRLTGNQPMIIGLAQGDAVRERRLAMLRAAVDPRRDPPFIRAIAAQTVQKVLARVGPSGRMDLVKDLARVVPIMVADRYIGVPGPAWLSPSAIAVRFNRLELSDVPPDWVAQLEKVDEDSKPILTMWAWTRLAFFDVFANWLNAGESTSAAQRTTSEMLRHIESLMQRERQHPGPGHTLMSRLMAMDSRKFAMDRASFEEEVKLLLLEFTVGGVETVSKAFTNAIDGMLDKPDLLETADKLVEAGNEAAQLKMIWELLRLQPVSPVLFRLCAEEARIGSGQEAVTLPAGTVVCLMLGAAMRDPAAFPDPARIDTSRDESLYLHFGYAAHRCKGDFMAQAELLPMFQAVLGLPRLRRAAGPAGSNKLFQEILADSLTVRFDPPRPPVPVGSV